MYNTPNDKRAEGEDMLHLHDCHQNNLLGIKN